jgi:hypothetical protein
MQIIRERNKNNKVCSVAKNISRHEMFICHSNVFRLYSMQKETLHFSSTGSHGFACIFFQNVRSEVLMTVAI